MSDNGGQWTGSGALFVMLRGPIGPQMIADSIAPPRPTRGRNAGDGRRATQFGPVYLADTVGVQRIQVMV